MMNLEVFLTSHALIENHIKDKTVVVIDVLRSSSTIVTALAHGARSVIPVPDMGEAGRIAFNMDPSAYVLGGERGGTKIDGYQLGNSPTEYDAKTVENRVVILNTTNGTKAITACKSAAHVVVGGFLNANRVVDFIKEQDRDTVLVCAGSESRVSLEDTLCAGLLLNRLWRGRPPKHITDTAHIAHTLYQQDRTQLYDAIRSSNHAKHLIELGFEEDIAYCLQTDDVPILPYYAENTLTLRDAEA